MIVPEDGVNDLGTVVPVVLNPLDWTALALTAAGALAWGCGGAFGWDPVAALLESRPGVLRAVQGLSGAAALYCAGLAVRLLRRRRR